MKQTKMKKNNETKSFIFKEFRHNLSTTLSFSGLTSIVVVILYALVALFFIYTDFSQLGSMWYDLIVILFLTILLGCLAPFIYSYFACNAMLHTKRRDEVKLSSYVKTSKFGFFPPFKGQLNIWTNLIYGAVIFIVIITVCETLSVLVLYQTNVDFKTFWDSITSSQSFENQIDLIYKNQNFFELPLVISNVIALFLASFFFLHRVLVNIFKYYLAPTLIGVPKRLLNNIFNSTIKQHKKEFYKGFYRYSYLLAIIFYVVFFLVYFLMYFTLKNNEIDIRSVSLLSLTSVVGGIIFTLPFLPILFNYYDISWPTFQGYFIEYFIAGMREEVERAKKDVTHTYTDEQISQAEHRLDTMKEDLIKRSNFEDKNRNEENKEDENDKK